MILKVLAQKIASPRGGRGGHLPIVKNPVGVGGVGGGGVGGGG